jgi:hypothetical protein
LTNHRPDLAHAQPAISTSGAMAVTFGNVAGGRVPERA